MPRLQLYRESYSQEGLQLRPPQGSVRAFGIVVVDNGQAVRGTKYFVDFHNQLVGEINVHIPEIL
jgi:hypothetical protein